MGESIILFAPGTQFMICNAKYDGSMQKFVVLMREVNVGGHGKTVLMFNETLN